MLALVAVVTLFLCNFCFVQVLATPVIQERGSSLPTIELPYGTYRAASYERSTDVYIFKNIRFAAPPVGDLRWAKPAPPATESGIQDGSYGHSCVQTGINGLNLMGDGNSSPIGTAMNQFLAGIPLPMFEGGNEDCLFLDVFVPAKAIKNRNLKLPVMVYVYGGGFVFGSKDSMQPDLPFYDGSGMIDQSGKNMIFVSINYRLGAYGFLAGNTMEKEGLPNAGLWDQRAAFQWVKDHIHLLGGDPDKVTAMGESAGGGSIVHHLVAEGGTLDPLFSKAILLSPAFEYLWDRSGVLEDNFQNFARLAGCAGQGLECLRSASEAKLKYANEALNDQQTSGSFAVGPSTDGSFIRQLPVLEFKSGNFYPIESLVMSHVADEALLFVSGLVSTNTQFDDFVSVIFPNYTKTWGIPDKICEYYPPVTTNKRTSKYSTQSDRVNAFLRDSSFVCNIRHLTEAYGEKKVWSMQYSVTPGWHGTDLFPVFYNPKLTANSWKLTLASFFLPVFGWMVAGISKSFQSYLTSYVVHGDPNEDRLIWNLPPTVNWGHPSLGDSSTGGVVNIGNWGFSRTSDGQLGSAACDFWADIAAAATSTGGYAPPGDEVTQGLFDWGESYLELDVSANYVGGNGV
ncbi:Lipase 2 [Zalerion maritima]|uniref:Lipase 2 n=1 Tax=Zalerion maritima TaxID=339359 RepID=A0AAD5RGL2_9PEZI|nr:Lipase 2 [Zalerion maritima]